MPDRGIFCNTPWYELHIYWDGSLGICCQEDHKLYPDSETYNIASMTIQEWFNSAPVRQFRRAMIGSERISSCKRCYTEEDNQGHSRRLKSNAKSVIFTKQAFDQSYKQSPGYQHFVSSDGSQGWTDTWPIDIHIDLGNHCNLACKMCGPRASSTIASQHVRWGIESSRRYLGNDWTRDNEVWSSFLDQLLRIPNLKNIHFMGGETLLSNRLEQLVDFFIANSRYDLCFSFVTNGTVDRPRLLEKLSRFSRVGIEVSIETMTKHNQYQRQGTDNQLVMRNLESFRRWDNGDNVTVALRTAPSILSVGHYHTLLDFAVKNSMVVKSNLCYNPDFMRIELLPISVKQLYLDRLSAWAESVEWSEDRHGDYNASDPHNARLIARDELEMVRSCLSKPTPTDSHVLLKNLVDHCARWDRLYGLDAREYYPELVDIFDGHGYCI